MQFKKFFNLSKSIPTDSIEYNADLFLKNKSLTTYYSLVKNGYQPTKKQINKFNQILSDFFLAASEQEKDKYIEINKLLDSGYKFNVQNTLDFIHHIHQHSIRDIVPRQLHKEAISLPHSIECENKELYTEHNHLYEHIFSIYQKPEIQNKLLETFLTLVDKYSSKFNRLDPKGVKDIMSSYLFILPETFSQVPATEYVKLKHKTNNISKNALVISIKKGRGFYQLEKAMNLISDDLKEKFEYIYSNSIQLLINENRLSSLPTQATKIALEQQAKQTIETFNTQSLPAISIQHIDNIKEIYSTILTFHDNGSNIDNSNLIINEKLPLTINSYLSMDPIYRLEMKNSQGKNSEQILLESLVSITQLLSKELQNLQQDNITMQSAYNRVLKAKVI